MRNRAKAVFAGGCTAAVLAALAAALWLKPPELIRVGANYTAKTVCSNVFLARRDADEVLRTDVQAPGHPLLRLMRVSVDREQGVVRAGLFGFIGGGLAVLRTGTGCAVLPDGVIPRAPRGSAAVPGGVAASVRVAATRVAAPAAAWPEGEAAQPEALLQRVLADDSLAGPGMRAMLVVHDGHIAAERYAPGFGPQVPQLGWSMTKSVLAGLIGILVQDGRLSLTQTVGPALHWSDADPRARISVADLLAMSSGLRFNEGYGAVSDVTRMLYLVPDMAGYASAQPLANPVGSVWSYSSGSALILSRIFQDAAGADALNLVRERLFDRLGMTSAIMETDERGTLVGSSYMYATPRDWARYGLMLAEDGRWRGRQILPDGYVAMMASPVAASGGEYGHGLVWRWATQGDRPGVIPEKQWRAPDDAFFMSGHDGQSVAIIPSLRLVIVRLGLTPSREDYHPEPLVQAVIGAAAQTATAAAARTASIRR